MYIIIIYAETPVYSHSTVIAGNSTFHCGRALIATSLLVLVLRLSKEIDDRLHFWC